MLDTFSVFIIPFYQTNSTFECSSRPPPQCSLFSQGSNTQNIEFHKLRRSFREINVNNAFWRDALLDIHLSVNYWYRNLSLQKERAFRKQEKSLLIDMFIELPLYPPEKCCQDNGTLDKLMGLVYVHGMLAKCHRVYRYFLENAVINIFLRITLVSTRTSAAAINSIQVPEELVTV